MSVYLAERVRGRNQALRSGCRAESVGHRRRSPIDRAVRCLQLQHADVTMPGRGWSAPSSSCVGTAALAGAGHACPFSRAAGLASPRGRGLEQGGAGRRRWGCLPRHRGDLHRGDRPSETPSWAGQVDGIRDGDLLVLVAEDFTGVVRDLNEAMRRRRDGRQHGGRYRRAIAAVTQLVPPEIAEDLLVGAACFTFHRQPGQPDPDAPGARPARPTRLSIGRASSGRCPWKPKMRRCA